LNNQGPPVQEQVIFALLNDPLPLAAQPKKSVVRQNLASRFLLAPDVNRYARALYGAILLPNETNWPNTAKPPMAAIS
jgi:hypothetical protein